MTNGEGHVDRADELFREAFSLNTCTADKLGDIDFFILGIILNSF